jgi:hypothetical protein
MLYLCYLYLFTYTQFPYQMMFVSLNLSTTGVSSRTGTSYPSEHLSSLPVLNGVRVALSSVF